MYQRTKCFHLFHSERITFIHSIQCSILPVNQVYHVPANRVFQLIFLNFFKNQIQKSVFNFIHFNLTMRFIWLAFDRSRYQTKRSTTFACEPKVPRTSESEAPACAKKKFVGALLLLIIFPAGNSRILNQFKQLQS